MRLPVQRCNSVDIIVLRTSIRDVTATQIDNPNLSVRKKLWTIYYYLIISLSYVYRIIISNNYYLKFNNIFANRINKGRKSGSCKIIISKFQMCELRIHVLLHYNRIRVVE